MAHKDGSSCGATPNERAVYAYDAARRITRTTHSKLSTAALIDDHAYAWDPENNKTSSVKLIPSGTPLVSHEHDYDSASRMINSVSPGLRCVI